MTVSLRTLLLFAVIFLLEKAQGQDTFGIVEPFPENIYPIEFTSAQVTCVAFDSSGVKTPDRIQFMRRNMFAEYTKLTENENLFFTNRTEVEMVVGPDGEAKMAAKLFVTLHIRNVTQDDDSWYGALGRYECHAFAVNDTKVWRHGFSVSVIRKQEIPTISVDPRSSVVHHGHNITITCKLTEGQGFSAQLKKVSWYKDGVKGQSVRCPDLRDPDGFVGPLVLSNIDVRDGGNYTCLLEVLLRRIKKYYVSDTTAISVAPWFDKPPKDLQFKKRKGRSVSFVCAAHGFPLEVVWLVEKIEDDKVFPATCITESNGKYRIERRGIYDPYVLTVSNLKYSDNGDYYCCVSTNCSSDLPTGNLCQRFRLQVKGRRMSDIYEWSEL